MTDVVVALDVGGTLIKCALVDATGAVRREERHPTDAGRGCDAVVDTILGIAAGLVAAADADGLTPRAVGVVVPGIVDEATGTAVWAANLDFRDVPLKAMLEQQAGLPAAVGHDVRAGGLAEARLGAGRGYRHVLFVPIGTGIAAANVVDGAVSPGAHGAAGEIGHVVVRPDGPRCRCGQRGCLESLASGAAVARRYAERVGMSGGPSAGTGAERAGAPASADRVAALAASGDPVAGDVWREAVDTLADGLLIGLALFDPEAVVVGGGLAEAGDTLLAPLAAALRARLTFHREPVLLPAALGDRAGCLGAALLALDRLREEEA